MNYSYEEEFAAVNPNDDGILIEDDEPIKMSVGIQNLLSVDFELEHTKYNCRGTVKGLVSFNYNHFPIKYIEIQLLKNEIVFDENKRGREPIIIENIELIDGSPINNDIVPFRIFLKSYNLTPTYNNVNNIFSLKYYLNLVIGDYKKNTFFKQTEIKLFRVYKTRLNPELKYGPWEEFINEPIYNEEYYKKEKENEENKDKDKNLNIFNNEDNEEIEEKTEEEDEEIEDEEDENLENDNINNEEEEFIINTSSEENKGKEKDKEKIIKKKKKSKKSGIVKILRANSLYKNDKENKANKNINNIEKNENIIIPFDEENDNNYINSIINSNFPSNSNNNLFKSESNDNNKNEINTSSKNNNSNYGKIIKFDD